MDETVKIRDEILEAALPNVAFDGWNWDMVCAAADESGYSANIGRAVFPEEMVGVLNHFADWADRGMMAALNEVSPDNMRVRDRVKAALMARYAFLAAHKDAVNQSLHYLIWPTRKARAMKITWRLADRIWDWAGDNSQDYNRYTKRGLLSGVIASTTMAWLNDSSEDMGDTEAFLDRRIENVMQLSKVIHGVKTKLS